MDETPKPHPPASLKPTWKPDVAATTFADLIGPQSAAELAEIVRGQVDRDEV